MADREEYIKALSKAVKTLKEFDEYPTAKIGLELKVAEDILALLKEQPEIVLCKDCRLRGLSECPCYSAADPYYTWDPEDDWFCGDGKRR